MDDLEVEEVRRVVPKSLRHNVDQDFVDRLNSATQDPIAAKAIRDNFITYAKVLEEGRFKTEDYLDAIKYVTFKLMNFTNIDSYARTFPDRYNRLVAMGTSSRDIASHVSMFNRGKLVNLILEQTMIPTWILNQDVYQKAINTQADIMVNAKSEMARVQAANSILTHLKKPDAVGPLINIDMRKDPGMEELKGMLTQLAQKQKDLIESGASTKDIAAQKLIVGEAEDVPD